ncbi:MAG: hypothetical protein JST20_09275 [Bacteroidetes bacterium]|nr:hypothetical protein [Bacteroidota bacterium]
MNSSFACNQVFPKRLECISRRFVLLLGLLLLIYYQGFSANNPSNKFDTEQFLQFDFSKSNVFDSTDIDSVVIDEDSTETESDTTTTLSPSNDDDSLLNEIDSTDEADTLEPKWSVTAGVNYKSQQQKNGVDLSAGKPVIGSSLDISHEIGLAFSINSSHRIENGGLQYQDLTYGINYTYSASNWVDLAVDYNRYHFASDSLNALSAQTSSLSLTADFYIKKLILDLSLDHYFGTDKQTYLSLSGIMLLHYKNLNIAPMLSISAVSYEIAKKRVKVNPKTTQATTKNTISLSSIVASISLRYPLIWGISATLSPSFIYSPIADLSSKRSQIIVTAGLSYNIDF